MGAITWIAIGIIVLAVIGLGAGAFFSGVTRGAQVIGENPTIKNFTKEAENTIKQKVTDSIGLGNSESDGSNESTGVSSLDRVIVLTSEKFIYNRGEPVVLTAVNIGDKTLVFPDSTLGLQVTNTDTGQTYSVISLQVITELQADQSKNITWYQEAPDRKPVEPGNYVAKIHDTSGLIAQISFKIAQ
jgi:hypothetical protein